MDKICKKELIATTIRHLRIFIAVAEAGKMSLAAKSLYIAQPTVSQAVAEIEAEYGVRLFDRLSKTAHHPAGPAAAGLRSTHCQPV